MNNLYITISLISYVYIQNIAIDETSITSLPLRQSNIVFLNKK